MWDGPSTPNRWWPFPATTTSPCSISRTSGAPPTGGRWWWGEITPLQSRHGYRPPRLAVIYKPTDRLSVKLIGGSGYRPPSVIETSFYDQDFIANLGLEPSASPPMKPADGRSGGKKHAGADPFQKRTGRHDPGPRGGDGRRHALPVPERGLGTAEGVTLTYEGVWGPWKTMIGGTWQDGETRLEGSPTPRRGSRDGVERTGLLPQRAFTAGLSGVCGPACVRRRGIQTASTRPSGPIVWSISTWPTISWRSCHAGPGARAEPAGCGFRPAHQPGHRPLQPAVQGRTVLLGTRSGFKRATGNRQQATGGRPQTVGHRLQAKGNRR